MKVLSLFQLSSQTRQVAVVRRWLQLAYVYTTTRRPFNCRSRSNRSRIVVVTNTLAGKQVAGCKSELSRGSNPRVCITPLNNSSNGPVLKEWSLLACFRSVWRNRILARCSSRCVMCWVLAPGRSRVGLCYFRVEPIKKLKVTEMLIFVKHATWHFEIDGERQQLTGWLH